MDDNDQLSIAGSPGSQDADERPYVAVATSNGLLVDWHLGEAPGFMVIGRKDGKLVIKDNRMAPERGGGQARWEKLAGILSDCRVLLVADAGQTPQEVLRRSGLAVKLTEGDVAFEVEAILR